MLVSQLTVAECAQVRCHRRCGTGSRKRTRSPLSAYRCQHPVICLLATRIAVEWQTFTLDTLVEMELCCRTDRIHIRTNDINQIVIRNSQLLLGLILSLLLIAVGLIDAGKRNAVTAM